MKPAEKTSLEFSEEPENCTRQYNEETCDECEFKNYNMVGHPGGSSYHLTEEYYCELGYWMDNF